MATTTRRGFLNTTCLTWPDVHEPRPPVSLPLPPRLVAAGQRLARVRPLVGARLVPVVVPDVLQHPPRQLLRRAELPAPQQPPRQHPEPDLHLVQPAAVLGRVVHHVLVAAALQEGPPLRPR